MSLVFFISGGLSHGYARHGPTYVPGVEHGYSDAYAVSYAHCYSNPDRHPATNPDTDAYCYFRSAIIASVR
jgi:hypothetical protein